MESRKSKPVRRTFWRFQHYVSSCPLDSASLHKSEEIYLSFPLCLPAEPSKDLPSQPQASPNHPLTNPQNQSLNLEIRKRNSFSNPSNFFCVDQDRVSLYSKTIHDSFASPVAFTASASSEASPVFGTSVLFSFPFGSAEEDEKKPNL